MRRRRGQQKLTTLCSGPGKLTQALGIRGDSHGRDLLKSPRRTLLLPGTPGHGLAGFRAGEIVADARIGISRSAHLPWRFLIAESPHLSVKPSREAFPPRREAAAAMRQLKGFI
jgi:DNA-3-methyladenine glycosylase